MTTRALVLRAPGINCDRETAHACRLAGFETDLLHINQLRQVPQRLLDYHLLVIPGGFSYGDDLGAGTLLAKNLTTHLAAQLDQFIEEKRLILGICNGFQVLVKVGLLPGKTEAQAEPSRVGAIPCGRPGGGLDRPEMSMNRASLTINSSAQFECRWVTLDVRETNCIFTQGLDHPIELPVAHGEGRFVLQDPTHADLLFANKQIPLVYATPTGSLRKGEMCTGAALASASPAPEASYPNNPNGSDANIAGICNATGNIFGLMPHPERYVNALQHPQRKSSQDESGDGLLIFQNAYHYATQLQSQGGHSQGVINHALTHFAASAAPTCTGVIDHALVGDHAPVGGQADLSSAYTASGVNIAAAEQAKTLMQDAVRATHGPTVLAGMGAFAGVLDISDLQGMRKPALVASTDGVGTKTLLAMQAGRLDTIGYDLVNHSVNDLLTQGAKPLFFMDYLAMGKLDPTQAATIVRSVASACREVDCVLLGGETAEMPDVYLPGAFDLAGTVVGLVEQDALINGATICQGDVLLGISSSGLHTNGYSLARRVFSSYTLDTVFPELGESLADALLRPHRCYLREVLALREALGDRLIKGIAHITGGGFAGNISRILPVGTQAVILTDSWQVPPLFQLLARLGQVPPEEMYRALNMGIGMVLVCSAETAMQAQHALPEFIRIGYITRGEGVVLH